jgi:hypothetical protein
MKSKEKWKVTDIADRLEQAAYTMRRMPKVTVKGYGSAWPDVVREFTEAYGYNEAEVSLGPPTAKHITEMDEAMRWLLWIEKDEVRLIWLRANCLRWKLIATRMGWGVTKLKTDWKIAIVKIAHILNSHPSSDSYPYKNILKCGRT